MNVEPPLAILTPTRDRPIAFSLCRRWMSRMVYGGAVVWVIVDDGDDPLPESEIRPPGPNWTVRYCRRPATKFRNTLALNLLEGLRCLAGETWKALLIVEDDDWYAPNYFGTMMHALASGNQLVGVIPRIDYHVRCGGWRGQEDPTHASLHATGISGDSFRALALAAETSLALADYLVDIHLWEPAIKQKSLSHWRWHQDIDHALVIGIKGMPGRENLGSGKRQELFGPRAPEQLVRAMGTDALLYADFLEQ